MDFLLDGDLRSSTRYTIEKLMSLKLFNNGIDRLTNNEKILFAVVSRLVASLMAMYLYRLFKKINNVNEVITYVSVIIFICYVYRFYDQGDLFIS